MPIPPNRALQFININERHGNCRGSSETSPAPRSAPPPTHPSCHLGPRTYYYHQPEDEDEDDEEEGVTVTGRAEKEKRSWKAGGEFVNLRKL